MKLLKGCILLLFFSLFYGGCTPSDQSGKIIKYIPLKIKPIGLPTEYSLLIPDSVQSSEDRFTYRDSIDFKYKSKTIRFLIRYDKDWSILKDTLMAYLLDKDTIPLHMEIVEDYDRWGDYDFFYLDHLSIFKYQGNNFFSVIGRHEGNCVQNEVLIYYINTSDYSLHRVKVMYAQDDYIDNRLPKDQFFWDGEAFYFSDKGLYSVSFIWNGTDCHASPTGGRLISFYKIKKKGRNDFVLMPVKYIAQPNVERNNENSGDPY